MLPQDTGQDGASLEWLTRDVTRWDIDEWIDLGVAESDRVEFKENIHVQKISKVLETITGMANIGGGCVLFGITDTPRNRRPAHPERSNIHEPDIVQVFFERLFADITQHIRPSIDEYVKRQAPIQLDRSWSVIVLKVSPINDNYLRTYQHVAYTRTSQPATIKMNPLQIWEFHARRLRPEIREHLFAANRRHIQRVLAEMAFQMSERNTNIIPISDVHIIIQKSQDFHGERLRDTTTTADLEAALKEHDILSWIKHRDSFQFISQMAQTFYTALHLNAFQGEDLTDYLLRPAWNDTVLMLAHFSDSSQLEFIIATLFQNNLSYLALRCLNNRSPEITISAHSRNTIVRFLERELHQSDAYNRAILLDSIAHYLMRDPDNALRMRTLEILSRSVIPGAFLLQIVPYLNVEEEPDDAIRTFAARVFADAEISEPTPRLLIDALMETLMYYDPDIRVLETMLIAVPRLARLLPDALSSDHADILRTAMVLLETWYGDQGIPYSRDVEHAINDLSTVISGAMSL
jgi:hypothetical protein